MSMNKKRTSFCTREVILLSEISRIGRLNALMQGFDFISSLVGTHLSLVNVRRIYICILQMDYTNVDVVSVSNLKPY